MFQSFRLQSIKTGLACCLITANALEIIVKLGIKTLSFFFMLKALIAISKAPVPLETATEYLEALENDDDVQSVYTNLIFGNN